MLNAQQLAEIEALSQESRAISQQSVISATAKARFDWCLARIAAIRSGAQSANVATEDEMRARAAAVLKESGVLSEMEQFRKDLSTGTTLRSYSGMNTTVVANGGYFVPSAYMDEIFAGMAQFDPLLDEANVRLLKTSNARPMTVPGIDLSSISATKVGQGVDNPPPTAPSSNIPAVSKNVLGGFSYRSDSLPATFELEIDSFESIAKILAKAFGTGLARGIGADLINGDGSTGPLGLLTAAANSGVTTGAAGVITAADINAIYFSLNRAYRNSPKCAWVLSDSTYELVRNAKDSSNRPLLSMSEDGERLMGKKVLIAPSMPSAAGSKAIVFGDLAQYIVRIAKDSVETRRNTQAPGYAENGIALYYSLMRADATLVAPGNAKPAVYATLHA